MKTLLTLDVLKTMSIDELEDYRAAGEDFRRELTHAVMRVLHLPSGWSVNGEYRSEFGGFFPVQIRFSPAHCHFDVAVCSPGELSERWMIVFVTRGGHPRGRKGAYKGALQLAGLSPDRCCQLSQK